MREDDDSRHTMSPQQQQQEHADEEEESDEERSVSEDEAGMRTDESIYGSSPRDSTAHETPGISLVFQLNSLTDFTSCSDNENVHENDYHMKEEKRKRRKRKREKRQSIGVTRDKQCKSSGDEDEQEQTDSLSDAEVEVKMSQSDTKYTTVVEKRRKCTFNTPNSVSSRKYRVMSQVELKKYDFEGKMLKLLSQLHEQDRQSHDSVERDSRPLHHRSDGNRVAFAKHTDGPVSQLCDDSVDCKLCNIISCRFNESWDLLDNETITLMDIIERLSRILSDKAKQLIVKLKRKQRPQEDTSSPRVKSHSGDRDDSDSENTNVSNDNSHIHEHTSSDPVKELKECGIRIRRVDNRQRFITLRDGPIEYCIQGNVLS